MSRVVGFFERFLPARVRLRANPVVGIIGIDAYVNLLKLGKRALKASKMAIPAAFQDDEIVLVFLYTHQELEVFHYYNINYVLRGGRHPEELRIKALAALLETALSKLPAFAGPSIRIMNMDASTKRDHVPGKIVTYKPFMSSGQIDWKPTPPQVRLFLMGKTGRYIGGMSRFPDEREVLFLPRTVFKVLSATPNAGTIDYVLEEQ